MKFPPTRKCLPITYSSPALILGIYASCYHYRRKTIHAYHQFNHIRQRGASEYERQTHGANRTNDSNSSICSAPPTISPMAHSIISAWEECAELNRNVFRWRWIWDKWQKPRLVNYCTVQSFILWRIYFLFSVVARNFRQGLRQSVAFLPIHPCSAAVGLQSRNVMIWTACINRCTLLGTGLST